MRGRGASSGIICSPRRSTRSRFSSAWGTHERHRHAKPRPSEAPVSEPEVGPFLQWFERLWWFTPPMAKLIDPTPADGPDPYGNPDPEWIRIDWREHLRWVDVP